MFKNKNITKIMNTLEALFIKIRFNPFDSKNKDLLLLFKNEFYNRIKFNHSTIKRLINKIEKIGDFELKKYILKKLKCFFVKIEKFDSECIENSNDVFLDIFNELYIKLENQEYEKVRTMASAVHNYPGFLLKRYKYEPVKFWNDHICYYKRTWNEDFLNKWEPLFKEYYKNQ